MWARLAFSAVYRCPACGRKTAVSKFPSFRVSLYRCCPRCDGRKLVRLRRRDRIDPVYRNPLSLVQALMGANLWWCPLCRLQFYDLRPGQTVHPEKLAVRS